MANTDSAQQLLTLDEACTMVRTPKGTLRYWIATGRLTAYRPGRRVLIHKSDLLDFVRRGRIGAPDYELGTRG